MNFEEFLKPAENSGEESSPVAAELAEDVAEAATSELEVQKAVVEALAADKVELDHQVAEVEAQRQELAAAAAQAQAAQAAAEARAAAAESQLAGLKERIVVLERSLAAEREREFDQQERNPNALALLDRDVELPDRFPGETRDQVLEVISEARAAAEREGRVRRAQVLESVLVANEPNGTLAKKRAELAKLFQDNGNLLSGPVLAELEKLGISHKCGEEYLLPAEILKRTY